MGWEAKPGAQDGETGDLASALSLAAEELAVLPWGSLLASLELFSLPYNNNKCLLWARDCICCVYKEDTVILK